MFDLNCKIELFLNLVHEKIIIALKSSSLFSAVIVFQIF